MRLTFRHFADFGDQSGAVGNDLRDPAAWDRLRMGAAGPFGLPSTRDQWVDEAEADSDIGERAQAIGRFLGGARSLASYGVGKAMLEFRLHSSRPDLTLTVTDYAAATVERLGGLFPEATVVRHDLRRDPPVSAEWHLFHRVDTEFATREWHAVFRHFSTARIVFVAGGMQDTPDLVRERLRWLDPRRGGRATSAGWVRNRPALEALWRRTHHAEPVRVHDLPGWALTPRAR